MNTNNIYDVQGRLATIDGVGSDTGVKPQHWYVSEKVKSEKNHPNGDTGTTGVVTRRLTAGEISSPSQP